MVICRYFLQGTCKFGDNCKFEHQINSDHSYINPSSSILLQNYANKPQTTPNVDTNTLVKSVVNDMSSAEKGGQWLLSSYAPFKEKPAFPGFEDHSMEELRYLYYEALKNGTVEQYKQNLQMMLQQAMMKIKALQNPTQEAINLLKNIYDTPTSSSYSRNENQTPSSSMVFADSQPPQKTIFGGGNPAPQGGFGTTNTNSIFGGAQASNNTVFAGNQTSSNIFAAQGQNNQSGSMFANPQSSGSGSSSNSIFSSGNTVLTQPSAFSQQQNSLFGPPNQSVFAPNVVTQQQNIFQQNNTPFAGTAPNANTPFSTNQASGPFAAQPNFTAPQNPNQFGPQNKPAFQHSQNIFGNLGMQTSNTFGPVSVQPNEEFYSKLEDLTADEINWFQSDDLDISKIPEKPPTYEMCFKVQ